MANPDYNGIARSQKREPIFNLPPEIMALIVILIFIHVLRTYLLSPLSDMEILVYGAFIPSRFHYATNGVLEFLSLWLTPFSYSFLHDNWLHLGVNLCWLVLFGTPVARRLGPLRFFALCAVTSAGGALAHYLTHINLDVPMIGASAVVSGMMGAAARFIFNGHLNFAARGLQNFPSAPLVKILKNRSFLFFVALCLGTNILIGFGLIDPTLEGANIAWQAHIGGFLAGLLLFSWFDPPGRKIPYQIDR